MSATATATARTARRISPRFPGALEPQQWCDTWDIPRLEACPLRGPSPAECKAGLSHLSRQWPGRNRTGLGRWIATYYAQPGAAVLDPMYGVGQMWQGHTGLLLPWDGRLDHFEVEDSPARRDLPRRSALQFREHAQKYGAVIFSPPYQGNHSSGETEAQRDLVLARGLSACQAFGDHPDQIGNLEGPAYWAAICKAYRLVVECDLHPTGHMVVIVRNRIRHDREVDEVGRHIVAMAAAGLELVGAHPRDLGQPSTFQMGKVAKGRQTAWVRWEWIVVGRIRR